MDMLIAAVMGLVYVAPPGPVNIETARRVAKSGAWAGCSLQLGSLLGDALYALLGLLGIDLVLTHLMVAHIVLGLGGIGLLLYLGSSALREGWLGVRRSQVRPQVRPHGQHGHRGQHTAKAGANRRTFQIGLVMSVTSPFGLAYWVSVGAATLQRFHGSEVAFVGCFLLAELLWALALPILMGRWRAFIKSRLFEWVLLCCGLFQIVSALTLGYTFLSSFV
jgi:chemosensory pili system protein ChpE